MSQDAAKEILKATHAGIIKIGDLELACAVLQDGTRVLSERGVEKALGRTRAGSRWRKKQIADADVHLPVYLSANNLKPFISKDLALEVTPPIIYKNLRGGGVVHGVDASKLPKICEVWLKARDAGSLFPHQEHLAVHADILMRGLAHIGIIALVDEVTGYQEIRDRLYLQEILEKYIAKELLAWTKQFPDEFYEQMFRLRGWSYRPLSVKRPSVVGHFTNDVVYARLAPSVLEALKKVTPKDSKGRRKHRLHQRLTEDVGHPKLAEHLSNVITLMRVSPNWMNFYRLLQRAFPKHEENLPLPFPDEEEEREES